MEIGRLYELYLQHPTVTTDTRKIRNGDIFFALKGPSFNGNDFVGQALDNGAAYVVADAQLSVTDDRVIIMDDALKTLQELAGYHRQQLSVRGNPIPFLAITGSNGKTTTKELIHAVLSPVYKTYTTEGNLNNHIGIPLTLLKIKNDVQIAVVEMGANNPKEIEGYCRYVKPTHGLITNFGKAHLQGFGSLEGVRKAKGELYIYLEENDGTVFVNADDAYMPGMVAGIKNKVTYGISSGSIRGSIIGNSTLLEVRITGEITIEKIRTQLVGIYNLANILAAATIGNYFKIDADKIRNSIESYTPSNSRSQMIRMGSNTIVLDAYNANPDSMKAAIENFARMEGQEKILMLGAMMELGDESNKEHLDLINFIDQYKWKTVVLVGKGFTQIKNPFINLTDSLEAKDWFKQQHFEHTNVLVKGSRSVQMEKVIQ